MPSEMDSHALLTVLDQIESVIELRVFREVVRAVVNGPSPISMRDMTNRVGTSNQGHVRQAIRSLRDRGMIEYEDRFTDKGRRLPPIYRLPRTTSVRDTEIAPTKTVGDTTFVRTKVVRDTEIDPPKTVGDTTFVRGPDSAETREKSVASRESAPAQGAVSNKYSNTSDGVDEVDDGRNTFSKIEIPINHQSVSQTDPSVIISNSAHVSTTAPTREESNGHDPRVMEIMALVQDEWRFSERRYQDVYAAILPFHQQRPFDDFYAIMKDAIDKQHRRGDTIKRLDKYATTVLANYAAENPERVEQNGHSPPISDIDRLLSDDEIQELRRQCGLTGRESPALDRSRREYERKNQFKNREKHEAVSAELKRQYQELFGDTKDISGRIREITQSREDGR